MHRKRAEFTGMPEWLIYLGAAIVLLVGFRGLLWLARNGGEYGSWWGGGGGSI